MSNCVGILVLAAVVFFGFFGFVAVEAGYPDPHEHEPFNLKYYGGHTPGPSEYEEEKLVGWFLPPKRRACNLPFFLARPICTLHCYALGKSGGYCKHALCWCTIY